MRIPQRRTPDKHREPRRPWRSPALVALLLGVSLVACSNPEFDAVAEYKVFLEQARPSLNEMNKVRDELFNITDASPDGEDQKIVDLVNHMLDLFKDDLLPEVVKLADLAESQPRPGVIKLADIHSRLQLVLRNYADSTGKLVERLEDAKSNASRGAAKEAEALKQLETALVSWGEADQKFGANMSRLVDDLKKFLDDLKT